MAITAVVLSATVLQFLGTLVLALFSFRGIKISENKDGYIEGMQKVEICPKWLRAAQYALVAVLFGILVSGGASVASASSVVAELPKPDAKSVYTLYRSSAVDGGASWRVHVATFDASVSAEYNRDNCGVAKNLFQAQPEVTVTYWCERGYFSLK